MLGIQFFFLNLPLSISAYSEILNIYLFMKKLIIIISFLLCFAGIDSFAQNYKYMTTDFAYKVKDNYGNWSDWSDWEDSRCLVNINLDREEISIYSDERQEFTIYEWAEDTTRDSDGGEQMEFSCVDADGLRCTIRLRVQNDGQMQLYVDYRNLMYVYCIEEK